MVKWDGKLDIKKPESGQEKIPVVNNHETPAPVEEVSTKEMVANITAEISVTEASNEGDLTKLTKLRASLGLPATEEKPVSVTAGEDKNKKRQDELETLEQEEKESFAIKKLRGLLDPLDRIKTNLRRQEQDDGDSIIHTGRFAGAITDLESTLTISGLKTSKISEAIQGLASVIKNTGERPKPNRDIEQTLNNFRRIKISLEEIKDQAVSIRAYFQEDEDMLTSLGKLKSAIEDKVDFIQGSVRLLDTLSQ